MINKICVTLLMFFSFTLTLHAEQKTEKATFAGGCFWCMEPPFDKVAGVLKTTTGYTGGTIKNPTYEQVSGGNSGHYEAVQILFDPDKISYQHLLQIFWHNIDPSNDHGQFCDKGPQYRSAIFFHDARQKQLAIESRNELEQNKPFPERIRTLIKPAAPFYPAESGHQNYYQTNPLSYKFYRFTCGRDRRLQELWGQPR